MFEKREPKVENTEIKNEVIKKPAVENETMATIKGILIPFVLAAIVIVMIFIVVRTSAGNSAARKKVVCAKKDIPANEVITKENVKEYFEIISVEAGMIPEDTYTDLSQLPEKFSPEKKLMKNRLVGKNDIVVTSESLSKYTEGTTLTSITVSAMENSVAGVLRHGDIVNVYATEPDTNQLVLMAENVYIEEVYDNSGEKITDEGNAVTFMIKVAPGEQESINKAIANKGIQLYKVN